LFAALEIATGRVTDACYDRRGKAGFLAFLKKVARFRALLERKDVLDPLG
jgi:hypothetical protein